MPSIEQAMYEDHIEFCYRRPMDSWHGQLNYGLFLREFKEDKGTNENCSRRRPLKHDPTLKCRIERNALPQPCANAHSNKPTRLVS